MNHITSIQQRINRWSHGSLTEERIRRAIQMTALGIGFILLNAAAADAVFGEQELGYLVTSIGLLGIGWTLGRIEDREE